MSFGIEFISDIEDALHRLEQLRPTTSGVRQRALVDETIAGLTDALARREMRLRGLSLKQWSLDRRRF